MTNCIDKVPFWLQKNMARWNYQSDIRYLHGKSIIRKQTAYRHMLCPLRQKEINVQEKRVTEIRNLKRIRRAVNTKAAVVAFFYIFEGKSGRYV